MPEIQGPYKIKKSSFQEMLVVVETAFSRFFYFLSLRRANNYWGIVYDSVTKQPLDPVIVRLLYVDGSEAEISISDLAGRYGFLARPGQFKIYPKKTNYSFPSQIVTGEKDGIYQNLYHGEFFRLIGNSDVFAPNIPMDPVGVDWNQKAKQQLVNTHPYRDFFFKMLASGIFWLGFLFFLVQLRMNFPNLPMPVILPLFAYIILLLLAWWVPEPRLWGSLDVGDALIPYEDIFLELGNPKIAGITFGKAKVRKDGRFLLRANPGEYLLSIYRVNANTNEKFLLAGTTLEVNKMGLIRSSFELVKNN